MPELTLSICELRVHVTADQACAPAFGRFSRAWSSAHSGEFEQPFFAETTIVARRDEKTAQLCVSSNGRDEVNVFEVADAHLAIERALYLELRRLLPSNRKMLHGAAVASNGLGYLFQGDSGTGKSSLCLAAMRQGFSYLSDDLLITDGTTVWGVPRAIQFAPDPKLPTTSELPRWLQHGDLDHETYPRLTKAEDNSAPLWIPGLQRTLGSHAAELIHVVSLRRGDRNAVEPIDAPTALAELLASSYKGGAHVDLGRLLRCPSYRLTWNDPETALSRLRDSE